MRFSLLLAGVVAADSGYLMARHLHNKPIGTTTLPADDDYCTPSKHYWVKGGHHRRSNDGPEFIDAGVAVSDVTKVGDNVYELSLNFKTAEDEELAKAISNNQVRSLTIEGTGVEDVQLIGRDNKMEGIPWTKWTARVRVRSERMLEKRHKHKPAGVVCCLPHKLEVRLALEPEGEAARAYKSVFFQGLLCLHC